MNNYFKNYTHESRIGTTMTTKVTILDLEFDVEVDSFTAFNPGVSSGPPENCYPPEGGEIEWHVSEDQPLCEFIQAALDNNETWTTNIEEQLIEISMEPPEQPEPDPDFDRCYD